MKRFDIDRIFGLMVKEYLDKGYSINTDSMRGIQGEIAKVDLLKGKELIRVSLRNGFDVRKHSVDTLVLLVGRYMKDVISGWTCWDDDFEDIERDVIYRLGDDWYSGNEEYVNDCLRKKSARWRNSYSNIDQLELGHVYLPDSVRKKVLNRVRTLPRCKSVKLSDIGKVWRVREKGLTCKTVVTYYATVREETRKIGEIKIA